MALIDFTLSNARRFYLSIENPLGVKGLTTSSPKTYVPIKALLNANSAISLGSADELRKALEVFKALVTKFVLNLHLKLMVYVIFRR